MPADIVNQIEQVIKQAMIDLGCEYPIINITCKDRPDRSSLVIHQRSVCPNGLWLIGSGDVTEGNEEVIAQAIDKFFEAYRAYRVSVRMTRDEDRRHQTKSARDPSPGYFRTPIARQRGAVDRVRLGY